MHFHLFLLLRLEQESRIFFNFHYFSEVISSGNWEEAEKYLSAFTSPNENTHSRKMFYELYKWKYYEASDRSDGSESVNILWKDLRRIPVFPDDGFDDLVEMIALEDIRVKEQPCCMDKASTRNKLCGDMKILAHSNPCLRNKLVLPYLNKSALLSLIFLLCPNRNGGKRNLKEDLICLILQFLYEEKFKNALHKLEEETKVFFNMNYLVELMILGQLGKAEEYLMAFTDPDQNKHSKAMFLEIQKLKYLESKKREDNEPSEYLDTMVLSAQLRTSVALLAKKNPALRDKLRFPRMDKSRLLTLMKQIMDWWVPCIKVFTRECNNTISLENVPVVSYLCEPPSPVNNTFNEMGPGNEGVDHELKEINDPSQCKSLLLPDCCSGKRITRLTYSPSGDYILALAEDGSHRLWTWWSSQSESCKANGHPEPCLYQPPGRKTMKNEIPTSVQNPVSCFAIKGSYLFSASGGRISVFDLKSFERVSIFGSPPPAATYFIFIPEDILAIGLDDGSILIHCLSSQKVKAKLEGHEQRITCLAFSLCFNVLISSGADGQLCVWSRKDWTKLRSDFLSGLCSQHHHLHDSAIVIQFDPYQIHILVVLERWIGIYEAPFLDCLVQWVPKKSDTPICTAMYSSDGDVIYVGFRSGCIKVVDSKTLQTITRVNPTVYSPPSNSRFEVYPVVVAGHPSGPNQIAVGLSNGCVHVIEPGRSRGERFGERSLPEDSQTLGG
ncbi:PREDICTED: topless-related protein 4 isoform X2 [Tarenaya hassleriana]|uniref:topless-related protein 4 isoform X2 n=1 Tax=Tarenaya hassleriana TaxID=28532 RepID=UPI00053C33AE|nr:PREDICTED: topless-related protein 4 isoform X2 [Tarenaya hassleriana]